MKNKKEEKPVKEKVKKVKVKEQKEAVEQIIEQPKEQEPIVQNENEGVVAQEKGVSKVYLEILSYGLEKDKKIIKKMFDKLQDEMAKIKKGKYCRILWYIDNGEKTEQEKQQWLIENAKCKYYVFAPTNHKPQPHFVRDSLAKIMKLEQAYKSFNTSGIKLKQNKTEENGKEENNSEVS
jgi:ribosomal protein L17